jgi:hypothetical protein
VEDRRFIIAAVVVTRWWMSFQVKIAPTNDVEFFTQIVLPTVEEFSRNPGDIRRGVIACLTLQAMNEHYFHNNIFDSEKSKKVNDKLLGDFKKDLQINSAAFRYIMEIANGTKHATKRFYDLTLQAPGVCGIAQCGFPMSSEDYVFTDKEYTWPLRLLTDHVSES